MDAEPRTRFKPVMAALAGDGSPASLLARALLVLFVLLLYGVLQPAGNDPDAGSGLEQVVWTLTYVISIVGLFVERRRAWPLIRRSLPILALVALIVASSSWSDYHDISFKRALELVGTSASAYFIVAHFSLLEFLEGWAVAAGTAAGLSLLLIVAVPSRGLMQEEYPGSWQGIFVHKNSLGQAMALGIVTILIVAYANGRAKKSKTLAIGAALLSGLLLAGSQSATSYVMFVVLGLLLVGFAMSRSKTGRRVLPVALAVGIFAVAIVAFNFDAAIGALGRDASLSGRTDIWGPVMEAIGNRPWFGYGYDTFWLPDGTGSAYLPVLLDWTPYHAHNGLLELSLDVGVVGVGVFLICLAIGLKRAVECVWRQTDILRLWPLVAMFYFVAGNITEANIAKYNGMNWVIFLIAFLYAGSFKTP
jgi:exopolysaccharide production protein ExoQ